MPPKVRAYGGNHLALRLPQPEKRVHGVGDEVYKRALSG